MVQFVSTVSQYMYSHNKVSPVAPAQFHQQKCNKMKWNLCADTSAHPDLCLLQSYVSIKYEAIVRHIQFIMIVIILIYCMNEQMRLYIDISTHTNLLLTNKDNSWFVLLQINFSLYNCDVLNVNNHVVPSHRCRFQLFESEPHSVINAIDL